MTTDRKKAGQAIHELLRYGLAKQLITEDDAIYARNLLLDCLGLDSYEGPEGAAEDMAANGMAALAGNAGKGDAGSAAPDSGKSGRKAGAAPEDGLAATLNALLDFAVAEGLIHGDSVTERDLLDTKLMNCLMPRPSEVRRKFRKLYGQGPEAATDWYYAFSQDSNYIRRDRIAKDVKWQTETEYGHLDITINLSKPEKDPRAIAAAKSAAQTAYPKCQLCLENEGYAGRMDHPARENHRVVPITLAGQSFFLQYSPYVYYNEHCIVFNRKHVPMKIDRSAFEKLFDFVRQFPHYMIGSNADLPIVGGSILSHDHFQGGRYTFPMEKAREEERFTVPGYEEIACCVLHWPLSVLRLRGEDPGRLVDLSDHILSVWRGYSDADAFIYAETDGEPHNTITPIARMREGKFEIDLALRNNITTEAFPLGVYHPHAELHHIKKENIGLIEVMGLAILPARLKDEMQALKEAILAGEELEENPLIAKHAPWARDFLKRRAPIHEGNIDEILREEIGHVFQRVLEDAGVYKRTVAGKEALRCFLDRL